MLLVAMLACSPASREASHLKRGKSYLDKKDYARAALEFRNAQRAMPRDAESYYLEGLADLGLENRQAAFQAFTRAAQLNPKHVAAQVKLTELLATSQQYLPEAEQHGKTALSLDPNNPDALTALGLTELRLGNEADAARYLQEALATSPQRLKPALALAMVALSHQDPARAEQILKKAAAQSPGSPEPLVALGELYLILRKNREAESALGRAVELDPTNSVALAFLARIAYDAGRRDQAEQTYRRLAALPDKQFRTAHAQFLFAAGKRDQGLAEFEKLYRKDPRDRGLRTQLVRAYVRLNRLADARRLLAVALKQNSHDSDALLERGTIELAAGELAAAENDLHQALHYKPDSARAHFALSRVSLARGDVLSRRQELAEALRLNPQMLPVRLELARAYLDARSPADALSLLNQAPDAQKTNVNVLIERNWALVAQRNFTELRKGIQQGLAISRARDLLLQDATLKIQDREFPAARARLEEILSKTPDDVTALDMLASTYVTQKQPKVALEKVRQYAARRPASAPVQYLLGRYLLENGDQDQARAAFLRAKTANARYYAADLALARMDLAAGRREAARQALAGVLASNDSSSKLAARLLLGDLDEAGGNHAAALAQWRKAVEADPSNIVALNNLAYVLLEYSHQPDEALKYAQQAAELAPDNPSVHDTLGWALYRKGMYGTAVQHLESAVALDGKNQSPASAVRRYHLAMAYQSSGQHDRGMQMLRAAIRLDPNLPEAAMAQQLLGERQ